MHYSAASINPLHKNGSNSACANYHPISMLPAASKVAEMYIVDILTDHLERNNLFHTLQHGFRRGHSTQSLLLYLIDSWYKSLDREVMVGVVFLDIAKAFDTISHSILLHKLKIQFYLSDQMCQWTKSSKSKCMLIHSKRKSPSSLHITFNGSSIK